MKTLGRTTFILMILSFFVMSNSCVKDDENHHSTIRFINNADKPIYVYGSMMYPDTLNAYGMGGGGASYPFHYKISPDTENTYALQQREFWEVIFRDGRGIPSDTLMVYVFDAGLLESHTTHVNNTIIRRYDLSLQDLQRVNWTLTYPPTAIMQGIKMYPPYKGE